MIAPLLCLALAVSDTAEVVLVTYDLAAYLPPAPEDGVGIETFPLSIGGSDEFEPSDMVPPATFTPSLLADLITNTVRPEEWRYEGRFIEVRTRSSDEEEDGYNAMLVVQAPPAVQEEVQKLLDYVAAATLRPIVVRVDFYRVPSLRPDLMPQGAEEGPERWIQQQRGGLERHASFRVTLLQGSPVARFALDRRMYLRDWDVEIAQGASISQPVPDRYALGASVALKAEVGAERVTLTFALGDVWQDAEPEPISAAASHIVKLENMVATLEGGGMLQSPRLRFASIAGSARLAAGESAVVMAAVPQEDGAFAGMLAALTLESVGPAPGTLLLAGRELTLAPVGGDLATGFLARRFGRDALRPLLWRDMHGWPPLALWIPARSGEQRIEEALTVLYTARDFVVEGGHSGQLVHLLGPEGTTVGALEQVRGALAVPRTLRPVHAFLVPERGGQPNAALPLFALSAAVGDALVVAGTQETFIVGNDVDVANEAAASNPQVEAVTSGYAARVHGAGAGADRQRVHVFMASQLRHGDRGTLDTKSDQVTRLDQPRYLSGFIDMEAQMAPGERIDAGTLPIPARGDAARARVEIVLR